MSEDGVLLGYRLRVVDYASRLRHGLNTRQKRLSLIARYTLPHEPPREPQP